LRCLLLTCSLTLVLPGGWCCMVGPLLAQGKRRPAAPLFSGSCCCDTAKAARSSSLPADPPRAPLPPGKCPCSGRYSTMPDSPKVSLDLSLPAALPPGPPPLAPAGEAVAERGTHPLSLDPSLHLMHCVWLC